MKFQAIVANENDAHSPATLTELSLDELPAFEVLVRIEYSSLNYKDALAVTGRGKICRFFPMVCGIDLAGTIEESSDPEWRVGEKVLVNGFGLSETHWGGFSQYQRVSPQWLTRLPTAFSSEQAMALGTAGYTAMLSVQAIEDHGVTPDSGEILVTGASGGVGSVSLLILSELGYTSVATTGRPETAPYLRSIGASDTIDRAALDRGSRPLESEKWAAAIDSVGSKTLVSVLAQTRHEGIVAACGLAGGIDLPATVMPFILRGVTLRGIDSVMASRARRGKAWQRLGQIIDTNKLQSTYELRPLSEVPTLAQQLLDGQLKGRVVIDTSA